jgi:hypothetical protein
MEQHCQSCCFYIDITFCCYVKLRDCLQALHSVATVFLAEEELPQELRAPIVQHMVKVHQSVRGYSAKYAEELRRHNYVTVSCTK